MAERINDVAKDKRCREGRCCDVVAKRIIV